MYSLWYDDKRRSTHLYPKPFTTERAARSFAFEVLEAEFVNVLRIPADELQFYFPEFRGAKK